MGYSTFLLVGDAW